MSQVNTIDDEEERRDLISLVVDAYDIFVDRVVDLKNMSYDQTIDAGTMSNRLNRLNHSMTRLYFLVNMHIDDDDIMKQYGLLVSNDIRRMNNRQRHEHIDNIIIIVGRYQKILGKKGLLPLLNEKVGVLL